MVFISITRLRSRWSDFSPAKFLCFPCLYTLYSLERSHCMQPHLEKKGITFLPLEGGCLHRVFRILLWRLVFFSPLYLLNHLFTLLRTPGCLFWTLAYNPVLLYFIVQIVLALTVENSFVSSCVPLIHPHCCGLFIHRFSYFLALCTAPDHRDHLLCSFPELWSHAFIQGALVPLKGRALLDTKILDIRCVCCYRVIKLAGPSELTGKEYLCVYQLVYIYIYVFLYVFIYICIMLILN